MKGPGYVRLLAILVDPATPASGFAGIVYRSCSPKYATELDLVSGEGSRRFGGRWNRKGIPMVYASLTPEVAMAEALASIRYFGIPSEQAMPRTFVAIDVRLARVLDLRNPEVQRVVGVSEARCRTVDWRADVARRREPITRRLGRAAHAAGWEGLVVPSAATDGHNLLIFPDRLAKGSYTIVKHADRLGSS